MLMNLMSAPVTSSYGKVIDRSWIVKGPYTNRKPAVEGVDFTLTEEDTKFNMIVNQYFTVIMLPSRAVGAAGKSLFFRVYVNDTVQAGLWKDGLAFALDISAGWHTFRCDHFANGQNRYTVDGVVRYNGPKRWGVDFYWSGPRTIFFDVGGRGGVKPSDCEWW